MNVSINGRIAQELERRLDKAGVGSANLSTATIMKGFRDQYIECKEAGLVQVGRFQSFEDHPELLPRFPRLPKLKKMMQKIQSGELKGLNVMDCKRFGGDCSSGHAECKKLRGVS